MRKLVCRLGAMALWALSAHGVEPVAGAYFEWDAAQDLDGNNLWPSATANTYDWQFDGGNQTPADVSDARFSVSKYYAFPAARDENNASFDGRGSNQSATFEFILDTDTENGGIFESGGTGVGIVIDIKDGALRAYVRTPALTLDYALTATDKGRFIHVIVVVDLQNDAFQLYVDGELKGSAAFTGGDWSGGNEAGLGGSSSSYANSDDPGNLTGKMAIFRFYRDKAFTVAEVTQNFDAILAGHTVWSDLSVSNVTATAAFPHATVSTNLASATLLWDTADKGATNVASWTGQSSLGAQSAGPVTGNATGLVGDTEYTYRFYGEFDGTNDWSRPATFATALTSAQTPAFTNKDATFISVTVEWQDNADTETGYLLQRSDSGSGGPYALVATLDADITTYTDTAVLSGTTYYYQLAATNDVNESGTAFSACVTSATTLVSWSDVGVSNITAGTASPYATVSANLTASWLVWDTSDKGDTNLLAWAGRSGDMGAQSAGEVTGNAISLTADTEYFFRFYGANAETYGWSQAATFATDLTAAQEPAFTNADASFYTITLAWADNADTETGYVLRRSINGADYAVVAELDRDVATHTDRGLLSGTTYYYQLAATNDVNESGTAFSACITNATTRALAAPWTPAYTNTALWLDAADAATILTSGSSVTNWSDKSGNGRDATQSSETKQPTYNATGFSGAPTLEFASSDDMMAGIAPGTFSSAISVYMVLEKHGYAYYAKHAFLRLSNGKAAPFNGRWSNSSNGYWNYRYVGNGLAETGFGRFNNFPAIDTPLLLFIGVDATTYTEMYNAVNAWSGSHGGTYGDTASDVIIGRNSAIGYSISEVVVTDSIWPAGDRQKMEGYLAWKWGMEGKLPAGHLYKDAPPLAPPAAGAVLIVR